MLGALMGLVIVVVWGALVWGYSLSGRLSSTHNPWVVSTPFRVRLIPQAPNPSVAVNSEPAPTQSPPAHPLRSHPSPASENTSVNQSALNSPSNVQGLVDPPDSPPPQGRDAGRSPEVRASSAQMIHRFLKTRRAKLKEQGLVLDASVEEQRHEHPSIFHPELRQAFLQQQRGADKQYPAAGDYRSVWGAAVVHHKGRCYRVLPDASSPTGEVLSLPSRCPGGSDSRVLQALIQAAQSKKP